MHDNVKSNALSRINLTICEIVFGYTEVAGREDDEICRQTTEKMTGLPIFPKEG